MTAEAWITTWERERRAGTPLVAVATPDVPAALGALTKACGTETACILWSMSGGVTAGTDKAREAITVMLEGIGGPEPRSVANMGDVLVAARDMPGDCVLVLANAHLCWGQEIVRDALQALRDPYKRDGRMVVLVAPDVATLPREVAPDTRVLREVLPARDDRSKIVATTYGGAAEDNGLPALDDAGLARAVDSTAGLTAFAVEQATAVAIGRAGLDQGALRSTAREAINARRGLRVSDEKLTYANVGGQGALADYVRSLFRGPDRPAAVVLLDEIEKMLAGSGGGDLSGVSSDILGALLTWIEQRKVHGILLMGPPGSGKSLSAQAAAGEHDVPLMWADIGAMKGSLVGESGANLRAALDTIDSVSEGRALLVATCNGVGELRPELLRRFKPRFMVDLPSSDGLEDIWRIQLAAHGLAPDAPRPEARGWTGAEVRDACRVARATATTPREAARFIVPISVSSATTIQRVRSEAVGRFICARDGGPYRGPDAVPEVATAAKPGARRMKIKEA